MNGPVLYAERYAVRVHPSLRGYHIAHKLRALAVDPNENVANLAREALHNGPHILPVLADELEAISGGDPHPAAGDYNWRAVARGLQIDQAIMSRGLAMSERLGLRGHAAENHAMTHLAATLSNRTASRDPRHVRARQNAERAIRRSVPDATTEEIGESIGRLAQISFERGYRGSPFPSPRPLEDFRRSRELAVHHTGEHMREMAERYPSLTDIADHRFFKTRVQYARPRRYASFPGPQQPTVTVRVPVPTQVQPQPKAPAQPVAPPPMAAPQDQDEPEFRMRPFLVPRALIFPHGGGADTVRTSRGPARMARIQYPDQHMVWKNPASRLPAKFLWRIGAEEDQYPEPGEIATVALATGYTGHLPVLDKSLAEYGHPLAGVINWANVPRALELDGHVDRWLGSNSRAHISASRMFGLRTSPSRWHIAQAVLRRRGVGLSGFTRLMADRGHTPTEVRDAIDRVARSTSLGGDWGHVHEVEPGQPIAAGRYEWDADKGEYVLLPSGRTFAEEARDPRSRLWIPPSQRYETAPDRRGGNGDQPDRLSRKVKMSREDLRAFLDKWKENPGNHLHGAILADFLDEHKHHAAAFALRKMYGSPAESREMTRIVPETGAQVDHHYVILPGHDGSAPFLMVLARMRDAGSDKKVGVGLGMTAGDPRNITDRRGRPLHFVHEDIGRMTIRFGSLTAEEARHLADLMRADGHRPYYVADQRGKADPHRWLDKAGIPRFPARRRPKKMAHNQLPVRRISR